MSMLLHGANRPPPGAYRADPLTIDEIDAHPDRERLWATILDMREAHETACDQARERALKEGYDAAYSELQP